MKTFIIAEAGINHNKNYDLAIKLIDCAKKINADAIKFQTAIPQDVMVNKATLAPYQKRKLNYKNQLEMAKSLHFNLDIFQELFEYSKKKKIEFISSPFDEKSLLFLIKLKLNIIKIPSGEILNVPLLRKFRGFKKRLFISTGMANLKEIKFCLKTLYDIGITKKQITVLQCNTSYPTPLGDVNLNVLKEYSEKFGTEIGYSDHTLSNIACLSAVAMGAKVIEKHITLDRNLSGPDHTSSYEPDEFKSLIDQIRKVEIVLGKNKKLTTVSEKKNIDHVRKSIVAKTFIKKGEKFSYKNITTKRPYKGLCSSKWDNVIGKKSKKDYLIDDLIQI